ncbi:MULTISPECIES: hypothetical protein [Flavobacterium]|uniref:hypothetical protein n=1 Tax=Flavobacterium TaxID=237 RepID=UPI002114AB44|nr:MULTISPECIES: hypothetical protein [Flavobacterium]UUF15076.1 hypothetical protein NLJ00_02990 [Flavobacterium panici]
MECDLISEEVKRELDIRIQNLEEEKAELYSWDEVKEYLRLIKLKKSQNLSSLES